MTEETGYVCPDCGGPVEFNHEDDVHQKWYACAHCEKLTTKPKKKPVSPSKNARVAQKIKPPTKKETCGACAYWMTDKCPFLDDAKSGTLKREDAVCGEFYSKTTKSPYFNDGRFIPKLLADELMEKEKFITFVTNKEIYVWKEGYFQLLGEITIEQYCEELLKEEFRKNRFLEVTEYIRACTFVNPYEPDKQLMNVENGVLNVETKELTPHNPELLFFNKLAVKFDPEQKGEKICKFIREITGSEEDAKVLEEVVGYCLYRSYPFQKALALVGEGANGKSTFLGLVKTFLGHDNVSGRGLVDLERNRFAKASLFGKLANIYADLSDDTLERTGTFKMLTGGDVIEAEKKFKNSFTFVNYTKFLFSCNKLPEVYDDTDAFFRRWIILVFPNIFYGDKCDPNILKKLTTPEELSGLLNIALEGLKRLLENNGFSYSKSTEETREDYIRKSDPLAAFLMDCIEEEQDDILLKQPLYSLFAFYCRKNNLPAVNKDTFFKNISKHVTVTQMRPHRKDLKGRPYAFKGITLTEDGKKLFQKQVGSKGSKGSTLLAILMSETEAIKHENNVENPQKTLSETKLKIEKTLDPPDPLDLPHAFQPLGSEAPQDTLDLNNIMVSVKSFCLANRNERSEVSLLDLAKFIQNELKMESQPVIKAAFDQAILMSSSKPGKAVVV